MMKISDIYPELIEENRKHEFKSQLSSDNPIKWAKTIVAYANGDGGIIFVGVSNDGEAFGLSLEMVDTSKNLVGFINNRHIFPHAQISFELRSVDDNADRFVLAVKVRTSDSIVRYKDGDFNETVFIKGDGNTHPASAEDIMSLSGRKTGIDNSETETKYDEQLWSEYCALCREYRSDGTSPSLKELQSEGIVSAAGFVTTGLMMFKDDYEGEESLIVCRLWKGFSKTGLLLDTARFKGSLSAVFSSTLMFMRRNTKQGWVKTPGGGRKETPAYPLLAMREALVNAIAHRDYSIKGTQIDVDIYDDRIDIVSPGSWLLPRSYEEYPLGSIPSIRRNTIIAAALDVANLMERDGTGFQSMVEAYSDSEDAKQPVVLAYPGFLDLRLFDKTFKKYPDTLFDSSPIPSGIVLEALANGPAKVKDLQELAHYSNRYLFLSQVINPLIEKGLIERKGNIKSKTSYLVLVQ